MAVMFSYDLSNQDPADHNRIQSLFERFNWERIGGSCYRYPKMAESVPASRETKPEDWLNCVVPALMLFRAYVQKRDLELKKYSLDAHSSTGYSVERVLENALHEGQGMDFGTTDQPAFGEKNLRAWLDAVKEAVPY